MSQDKRTPVADQPNETDQAATTDTDDAKRRALKRVRRVAEHKGFQTRLDDEGRVRIWRTAKVGFALVVDCAMGAAEKDSTKEELYYTLPDKERWLPADTSAVDDEKLFNEITHQLHMADGSKPTENHAETKPERPDLGDEDDWDPDDRI